MSFLDIARGDSPLVLGLPHTGTEVPGDIHARLNETGRALADTDWHVERLYSGLAPGATTLRTRIHRYVIDANRDPDGSSLYPGQNTTGLCPVTDFDGRDIYLPGMAPGTDEVADRTARFHAPYHAALAAELDRVKARHGHAILFDCHSIRSHVPFLFDGQLPDLNVGTNGGGTCAGSLEESVTGICAGAAGLSFVLNGRFKGGWTTRHYGQPAQGVHAIQLELAQSTYLAAEAPPWAYDDRAAGRLRRVLQTILETLISWRPE